MFYSRFCKPLLMFLFFDCKGRFAMFVAVILFDGLSVYQAVTI